TQVDGKILVGGAFTNFNGVPQLRFTRLHGGQNPGAGELGFGLPQYSVSEAGPNASITVVRAGGTSNTVAVAFGTTNGTAVSGIDYVSTNGTLTFAPGVTHLSFSVPVIDDILVRPDRTVLLGLANVTGGAFLSLPSTAVLRIEDNDSLVAFAAPSYSLVESGGNALITVVRTGGTNEPVSVQYFTAGLTATADLDFTNRFGSLVFGAGVTNLSFIVPVAEDGLIEGNETVALFLRIPGPSGISSLGAQSNATLTIVDNDFGPGVLGFASTNFSAFENEDVARIIISRTNGSSGLVSVNFATVNGVGNASAGSDYLSTNGALSFADGETSKAFHVKLLNDTKVEGNETVGLTLVGATGGASLGLTNALLTIVEDDTFGTFQFSTNNYIVSEGSGSVTVVINRFGDVGLVSVDVISSNLSALAGLDYIQVQQRLDFLPGQTSGNIIIQLINDQVVELPESFSLVLTNATGGALLGAITNATVLITDDDMQFSYALTNFNIQENANVGSVSVIRYGVTNVSGTVDFATANGTALHGVDYTGVTNTLIFLPGVTNTNFSVAIADNLVVQQNRFVSLSLFNPTAMNIASVGTNATATMTIVDNDNSFSFSASNYTVNEAVGLFGVSVLRFGQNTGVVSVAVSTLALGGPGAAMPNVDYSAIGSTLSFNIGQSNLNFILSITNDLLPEGNESFGVILTNPQPAGASQLGPTNAATITIVDDDIGIGFSSTTYSVAESAGAQTITIVRAGATNVQVGVSFATTNGTAVAGDDYVATNATFAFAAGVTTRTFTVSIINDAVSETSETILLGLFAPTGGAFLTTSNAVLTITDNVGSVGFTVTNFPVNENSTNGVVFVTRLGGSFGAIAVRYFTVDGGTATRGLDYEDVNGTISWNDGESGTKSFTVPVYNDQLIEPTETVELRLNQVSGGASLSLSNATLSIGDNDGSGGVDFAFDPGVGFDSSVYALAQQSNGQLLAAGRFTSFGATNRNRVARLNFDGTLDSTYNLGLGPDNAVNAVALQPDGRLVIGGDFTSVGGTLRSRVARLLVDGSIDTGFNPGSGANSGVNSVALQADGKVLVGGGFTNFSNNPRGRIARLNTSGSLDTTFNPGTGANGFVNALAVYGSGTNAGKILVGGSFTTFNGSTVNRLVRLTASGAIDTTFNTGTGANSTVASV
ncbi:MAG: hypothetical protein FJ167_04070, partial [Gammaproteobacteria bacterium]|nr:hypothetical protein [Gammaproteobacteria bacterium]